MSLQTRDFKLSVRTFNKECPQTHNSFLEQIQVAGKKSVLCAKEEQGARRVPTHPASAETSVGWSRVKVVFLGLDRFVRSFSTSSMLPPHSSVLLNSPQISSTFQSETAKATTNPSFVDGLLDKTLHLLRTGIRLHVLVGRGFFLFRRHFHTLLYFWVQHSAK